MQQHKLPTAKPYKPMKQYIILAPFLITTYCIYPSDDFMRSAIIMGSPIRKSRNNSEQETQQAIKADKDIDSLTNLFIYLNYTSIQNKGNLCEDNLQKVQKYWKEVAPALIQKIGPQSSYTKDLLTTITLSLAMPCEERRIEHNNYCITTYERPIKIDTTIYGFKSSIQYIITDLVSEYHLRRLNKNNPFPINIFPKDVNAHITPMVQEKANTNIAQPASIATRKTVEEQKNANPNPSAQQSTPGNQNIQQQSVSSATNLPHDSTTENNACYSTSYIEQLNKEDEELCQLTSTINLGNSSVLYDQSTSSTSYSHSGSGTISLATSRAALPSDDEEFTFTTKPKPQYAPTAPLTTFSNGPQNKSQNL